MKTGVAHKAIYLSMLFGVLVLGLTAWAIAGPVFGHQAVATALNAPVPDIVDEPNWATGALAIDTGPADYEAVDLGVQGVIGLARTVGHTETLRAYDLAGQQTLWALSAGYIQIVPDGRGGVVMLDDSGVFQLIDVKTGNVRQDVAAMTSDSYLIGAGAGMVITQSDTLCGRMISDLGTCVWQTSGPVEAGSVFAGGRFINTSAGVLDVASGQPASFGSDDSIGDDPVHGVSYSGRDAGHVVRITTGLGPHDQTWTSSFQVLGGAGASTSGTLFAQDPGLPGMLVDETTGPSQSLLKAYSWSDGSLQWQAGIDLALAQEARPVPGGVFVSDATTSCDAVVASQTGHEVWTGCGYQFIGAGRRVVYLQSGTRLDAFDGASPNFALLWSVDLPAGGAEVSAVGGHMVALSGASSQFWLLGS